MGEPAGIGGELTCKAWLERRSGASVFAAVDDPSRLQETAAALSLDVPVTVIDTIDDAPEVFADALPVLSCPLAAPSTPGHPDPANAPAVIASIREAVALVQSGGAAGLVTNPIQKKILAEAGFAHPGHTEFLGELAGSPSPPVMMLAVDGLRVVPVTVHLPLAQVPAQLTTGMIVEAARTTAAALQDRFGIATPRLAVAALNPHAGEGGMLGREETEIIGPAIDILTADGLEVTGPHPADTLFHEEARKTYDAAICMYHDQALVPLKTLDFHRGVNVTLGLPFVRTSPDHGTALDIAGQGIANPASFLAALDMAAAMAGK